MALANGNAISVTASPETGKVVYVETDWGGDAGSASTEAPGMTFGATKLADIRKHFQSNGFGFKSSMARILKDDLSSINCYEIEGSPDLVVAFVTTLPIKDVATVASAPRPDTGKGHLDAVILADLSYLKGIWGQERLFDATYHPVAWK